MMEDKRNEHEVIGSKYLQYVVVLLGMFTPYAYLLGTSFYHGYMTGWGVDAENFPISTADTYVFAYDFIGYIFIETATYFIDVFKAVLALSLFPKLLLVTLFVLMVYLIIKAARSVPFKQKSRKLGQRIKSHWLNNDLTKALTVTGFLSYILTVIVLFMASIAVLWWAFPILADRKGSVIALEKVNEFQKNGCIFDKKTKWNTCTVIQDKDGKVLYEGVLIAKNNADLAILLKDESRIIKLKDDYVILKKLAIK